MGGEKTINSSGKLMVNICQICYDSDYNYKNIVAGR